MHPQHNSSAGAALLQLSQTLLAHSHLPHTPYQAAWGIATQHFISLGLPATAASLSVALGTCTTLSQLLQQQLVVLVDKHHIIKALLECLDHTLAHGDHTAAAALLRAVHRLTWLQLQPHNAAAGSPLALQLIWDSSQQRQRLLQAACSSAACAEAVAPLAVAAASHSLPAAALLQDLLARPVSAQHSVQLPAAAAAAHGSSSRTITTSSKAWVAVALEPLLQHIQQQLPVLVQSAPSAHFSQCNVTHTSSTTQTHAVPAQQRTAFQQLWLLLCTAARITDGQLLSSTALTAWGTFLQDSSVVQAVHTALLQPNSCCPGQQPDQESSGPANTTTTGSTSTSSSSSAPTDAAAAAAQDARSASSNFLGQRCSSRSFGLQDSSCCCRRDALRAPTLSLMTAVAAHSASLAQQCFHILAPVLPDVMLACETCSSSCCCMPPAAATALSEAPLSARRPGRSPVASAQAEAEVLAAAAPPAPAAVQSAAEARAAVLQVWQQLLLKGRSSFPGALHALLQQWLPTAVEALAAAGQIPPSPPAAAPADAAVSCTCSSARYQCIESPCRAARAAAVSAAMVPLAWQLQAAGKPLLCADGPAAFVSVLTPHVPVLLSIPQSAAAAAAGGATATAAGLGSVTDTAPAAAAAGASRPNSNADAGVQQGTLPEAAPAAGTAPAPSQWVLLLATWLLQSWVTALQHRCGVLPAACMTGHAPAGRCHPQSHHAGSSNRHTSSSSVSNSSSSTRNTTSSEVQEPGQVQHTAAASILSRLGPQMVQAAAALVGAEASETLQVRCQTKALDLAQAVLAVQAELPACTQAHASTGLAEQVALQVHAEEHCAGHLMSPMGTTVACAPWGQLLAALGALFARSPRDPMSLAHRQLLQTACQMLSGMARHMLPPQAAAVVAAGAAAAVAGATSEAAELAVGGAAVQGSDMLSGTVDGAAHQVPAATMAAAEPRPAVEEDPGAAAALVPCNGVGCVPVLESSLQRVLQGLCRDLGVLHQDLATRKTARSSSREELLQAVEETHELLLKLLGSKQ